MGARPLWQASPLPPILFSEPVGTVYPTTSTGQDGTAIATSVASGVTWYQPETIGYPWNGNEVGLR